MSRPTPACLFRLVRLFQPSRTATTTLALAYQRLRPAASRSRSTSDAVGVQPANTTPRQAAGC